VSHPIDVRTWRTWTSGDDVIDAIDLRRFARSRVPLRRPDRADAANGPHHHRTVAEPFQGGRQLAQVQ